MGCSNMDGEFVLGSLMQKEKKSAFTLDRPARGIIDRRTLVD